jgi:hypothetical protein
LIDDNQKDLFESALGRIWPFPVAVVRYTELNGDRSTKVEVSAACSISRSFDDAGFSLFAQGIANDIALEAARTLDALPAKQVRIMRQIYPSARQESDADTGE